MVDDLRIIFRIGPTSTRDKKTFDSSSLKRFEREGKPFIEQRILEAVEQAARQPAFDEFVRKLSAVQDDIRNDLKTFAEFALRFFFSQKSAAPVGSKEKGYRRGRPLRILFSAYSPKQGRGFGFKSGFGRVASESQATIYWPALAPRTIKNKKGDTTYFVHTGDLFNLLSRELFPFLTVALSPTIQVTQEDVTTGETTRRIATVKFSVAASKKGVNLSNVPALKTGDFRILNNTNPGADYSLLDRAFAEKDKNDMVTKFFGEKVAYKLTNLGHGDDEETNRPLVSPLLGYYVVTRFPRILEAAITRHFKVAPPRDKKARRKGPSGLSRQFEG